MSSRIQIDLTPAALHAIMGQPDHVREKCMQALEDTRFYINTLVESSEANNRIKPYRQKTIATDAEWMQFAAELVCNRFGVHLHQLRSKSRKHKLVSARQAFWYIMRDYRRDITLRKIAAFMGRADHTTALYGIQQAQNLIDTMPVYAARIEHIRTEMDEFRDKTERVYG